MIETNEMVISPFQRSISVPLFFSRSRLLRPTVCQRKFFFAVFYFILLSIDDLVASFLPIFRLMIER